MFLAEENRSAFQKESSCLSISLGRAVIKPKSNVTCPRISVPGASGSVEFAGQSQSDEGNCEYLRIGNHLVLESGLDCPPPPVA